MENITYHVLNAFHLEGVLKIDIKTNASPWTLEGLKKEMDHPSHVGWVALNSDHEVVGFLLGWLIIDQSHLLLIAVDPLYQHNGIGKKLFLCFKDKCLSSGIPEIVLEVRQNNFSAQYFYENLGGKKMGRRKKYYPDNMEDALLYSFSLTLSLV